MSAKGKIAKQETGRKAIEILAWIVEQANSGKVVILEQDWGGNSLTVHLGSKDDEGRISYGTHTHVGMDEFTMEQLVENFHSTVTGRGGLSWA